MEFTIEYTVIDCTHCDFQFALPNAFITRRRCDHRGFVCPSCVGRMAYNSLNDKERLKRQLSDVQECCTRYEEESESLYRSNVALKGHITWKKKQLQAV